VIAFRCNTSYMRRARNQSQFTVIGAPWLLEIHVERSDNFPPRRDVASAELFVGGGLAQILRQAPWQMGGDRNDLGWQFQIT